MGMRARTDLEMVEFIKHPFRDQRFKTVRLPCGVACVCVCLHKFY